MQRILIQLMMEYGARAGKSVFNAYNKVINGKQATQHSKSDLIYSLQDSQLRFLTRVIVFFQRPKQKARPPVAEALKHSTK